MNYGISLTARFLRSALLIVTGMIAGLTALVQPAAGAEARGGRWEPDERAQAGLEFFNRVKQEFTDRARRLREETGTAPEIKLPFLDAATSGREKDAKDWDEFAAGKMGEGGTTRWIGKGLKELESARKKLAAAEKAAKPAWDKKYPDGRKPVKLSAEMEAFIYDIQVQARNLGVILDNSPSMRPALPVVRAEISARFTGARYVEVDGCQLEPHSKHWGPFPLWFYTSVLEERNPFDPKWFLPEIPQNDIHYQMVEWKRNALAALEAMILNMEVDAIYWFCDFDDEIQLPVVQRLGELIETHKVRLYVHTVKSNPPGSLVNIIRRSGGKMTKADPKSGRAADNPAPDGTAPAPPPANAGTTPAPNRPASSLRHKQMVLNDGEVIVHANKLVEFEATVKKVSLFGGQHVRIDLEGTELYAACRATSKAAVFGNLDPVAGSLQPGDRLILRGRITPFNGGHYLLMENKDDFFVSLTIRDVPGQPGMKRGTSSIRVEIPGAGEEKPDPPDTSKKDDAPKDGDATPADPEPEKR